MANLSSFLLGNKTLFSDDFLSILNLLGIVSGDPTSKNYIFETGHHFVVFFKITLQERMSDPSDLLTSTILLTLSGFPFFVKNIPNTYENKCFEND